MGPLSKKKFVQMIVDHFGCTKSNAELFLPKLESFELIKEEVLSGSDAQGNAVSMPVKEETINVPITSNHNLGQFVDDKSNLSSQESNHLDNEPLIKDAQGNDLGDFGHKLNGN